MKRPIVIVNPLSSGIELAPAFKARGMPAIAVTLDFKEWPEFGSRIRSDDFVKVIANQPKIAELLKAYNPLAIIPGTEEGIALAEQLTAQLTPQFANDPRKSLHRSNKGLMQEALKEAGVPTLKSLETDSVREAELWIKKNGLRDHSLVLKPPVSSGSEKVFHVSAQQDFKKAFNQILNQKLISGIKSQTVVVQEEAIGVEYAVGTVSANGEHFLAHLMKYNKTTAQNRRTVFDHVEFVSFNDKNLGGIFEYTKRALDALGVRWGPAHNEIMLTRDGPRLIETSPRMIGGPVIGFSRVATRSSQADKWVEILVDGSVGNPEYVLEKSVVPVFLKSNAEGTVSNIEVFDGARELGTLLSKFIWFKNGDRVPLTVDYLSSIGIIALAGDRDSIFKDYKKVREIEASLRIDAY